uniref:Ig-like domain-containing protein n=1 Tax=Haplochromis burtoni TaxID=8153 RepID=A0A3Q2VNW7_HAPBU
ALLLLSPVQSVNVDNCFKRTLTGVSAEVFSSEGRTVTVSCNYSVQAQNLQWYRQDPGSAPQFLLLITDTSEPTVVRATPPNPRLTAALDKERNRVNLEISSAAVSDSAVYYCALQPTVTGNSKTLYKNLWSKQNTPQHPLEGATHC